VVSEHCDNLSIGGSFDRFEQEIESTQKEEEGSGKTENH
jgi:hypothetical protein